MEKKEHYHTRARRALEAFFSSHPDACFTARDIIREESLSLSEPTVFRLLSQMTADGVIERFLPEEGGGASYRWNECAGKGHFHLKCDVCGELICADCDFLSEMEKHFSSEHGFELDSDRTVFYGRCEKCRKKEIK